MEELIAVDTQPVAPTGRWAGDGARIAGRAVLIGGIAIGLMFGLVWWMLAGWRADRLPVSEVALPQGGPSAGALPFATPPARTSAPVVPAPPLPGQPTSVVPPPATVAPPPLSTTITRPPAVLAGHYATTTTWDTGYVAQITITAAAGPQNYEVRLQLPAGVTLASAWSSAASGTSSVAGATVTLRGGPVSAQRSVTVGFQANKSAALAKPGQFEPTSCTVNGNPCG